LHVGKALGVEIETSIYRNKLIYNDLDKVFIDVRIMPKSSGSNYIHKLWIG